MRRMVGWSVLGLALVVGCGEDPPPARPKIPVVSGPVVEHADASGGTTFAGAAGPCCGTPEATAVVGAFIGLGEAMAADDAAAAKERAGALGAALAQATTATGVDETERATLESMAALVDRVGAAADLEGAREEFLDLSTPMLAYARAHKGGSLPVAVAFCPMKPGRWLQVEDTIANPYYGAQMLTCGVFEPGMGAGSP